MKFKVTNNVVVEIGKFGGLNFIKWFQNGKPHREKGPAVIYESSTQYYCLEGLYMFKNAFERKIKDYRQEDK